MLAATIIDNRVICAECGHASHSLLDHVREDHGLSPQEYLEKHPGKGLVSQELLDKMAEQAKGVKRKPINQPDDLTVKLGGYVLKCNPQTMEMDALPCPPSYFFPSKGKAKKAFTRALRALVNGRNLFLHGMPGTGKDALVHAYSFYSRRPVVMVTFKPGTDLAPWFYVRSIGKEGTGYDYGHVWDALVNGIEDRKGNRRAPLMLLSDADRADSAQVEWFRILTDSISGRILDPHGKMVPLFRDPITGKTAQFACTANSVGSGDARGRMASANPMDASIMDRLGKKVQAEYMHWDDESRILKSLHPELVAQVDDDFWRGLGNCTASLRKAIKDGDIMAELTMRGLNDICEDAIDILLERKGKMPKDLLGLAMECWFDGLDEDNRFEAKRLADPNSNSLDLDLDDEDEY